MDSYVLFLSAIVMAAIVYQIWRGETLRNKWTYSSGVSRKIEPGKFWLAIALQLIVVTGFALYFGFR